MHDEGALVADALRVVAAVPVELDQVRVAVVLGLGWPLVGVDEVQVDALVVQSRAGEIRASASSQSGELSMPDSHGCW